MMRAILIHYRVLCEVPNYMALVPHVRPGTVQESDLSLIFRQPCQSTTRTPQQISGIG
jgi:hypothetical protein